MIHHHKGRDEWIEVFGECVNCLFCALSPSTRWWPPPILRIPSHPFFIGNEEKDTTCAVRWTWLKKKRRDHPYSTSDLRRLPGFHLTWQECANVHSLRHLSYLMHTSLRFLSCPMHPSLRFLNYYMHTSLRHLSHHMHQYSLHCMPLHNIMQYVF